ncbi:Hydrogenase maturation factor HypC [uncultured bacterium]|nr:Hydrogenase maturation factor HypC [uncultured bacterium]
MCLGIPGKIIEIKGDTATIDVAGTRKDASLRLMEKAAIGEYVIIHAGFAIEKVDTQRAEETLRLIRETFGR